jgi:hypothetical protein
MMTTTATTATKRSKRSRPVAAPRRHRAHVPTKGEVTPTPDSLQRLSPDTSLNDIERGTGISVSHLSRVFNGKRNFSSDNLQAVSAYLGVSVDRLLAELAKVG